MKLKFLFLCFFYVCSLSAQTPFQWAIAPDSTYSSFSRANSIVYDNDDNILVTGMHIFPLSIGGFSIPVIPGNYNVFTAKLDKNSVISWIRYGSGDAFSRSNCTDNNNNVYVFGEFSKTFTVGTTVLTDTYTPVNNMSKGIFILKYAPNGTLLWAKKIGKGAGIYTNKIKNKDGFLYITGNFAASTITPLSLGTTTFNTFLYPANNNQEVFFAKLDTAGNFIFSTKYGGSSDEFIEDMCISSAGDIFLSGSFTSSLLTIGSNSLSGPSNKSSIFYFKMDPSGNVVWAKKIDNVSSDGALSMCLDPFNNLYLAGKFRAPSFVVDNITLTTVASADNGMVIKFNSTGTAIWAKSIGGTPAGLNSNSEKCNGICSDNSGNVYVLGSYLSPTLTIGAYSLSNPNSIASPNTNRQKLFVAQFDAMGNVAGVLDVGGQNSTVSGSGILIDNQDNLNICGYFEGLQIALPPLSLFGKNISNSDERMFVAQAKGSFTGIKTVNLNVTINVYPVPSQEMVSFVSADQKIELIEIFDLSGKKVHAQHCFSNSVDLSIKHLSAGVYLAKVTTSKQQSMISKIIKED